MRNASFSELAGVTLDSVEGGVGSDEIVFHAVDGHKWKLYHEQGCCESVSVEEIHGDLGDLVGVPILQAEESTSDEPKPEGMGDDSWTWTFYRLTTIKGSVQIRWFGTSNGYYSECVSFAEVTP